MNTNYLILINEDNKMPDNFLESVQLINVVNCVGDEFQIEAKTYQAYLELREDLIKNDGIQIELDSVYRSVERQVISFERYVKKYGIETAKKYVAKPGHSEHHTGMAIDVGIVIDGKFYRTLEELFSVDNYFLVVQQKLSYYGFILRYPKGKEHITKVGYEPWHFRFINSPKIAKEITDKGLCFEEYCEILKKN